MVCTKSARGCPPMERVEYSKGKVLDLELLLNRIGSVFKPIEDETPEEEFLQAGVVAAAHGAQVQWPHAYA